ncbi:MAG: LysM peptidoglycan-binding domain-containing protein [Candidatus Nanopelagicaceae bacterium]|nr:LysM peptidoglycan-binding domain-containing protein [Candidatus Nanopelagicaceae bacterium]
MATSPATLTNRGRTVLMVSALIVATSSFAATFSAFNGAAASTASISAAPVAAAEIIVQPGESYWSIARAIAPRRSTQDLIDQIHQLNPFAGATLQAGTKILVPLVK